VPTNRLMAIRRWPAETAKSPAATSCETGRITFTGEIANRPSASISKKPNADAPHAVRLLRPCRQRPSSRANRTCDELAPSHHSITSSAMASKVVGTSGPSALAVLRFNAVSNLTGI
jgi:hypothetical protein